MGAPVIGGRYDDRGVLQLAQLDEQLRGFDVPWPAGDRVPEQPRGNDP